MRSDILIVACPHRLPRIECRGGIQARRTAADTVHMVSAAATPLGGDVILVRVVVEPGARLVLRSAAAMVALPGRTDPESHTCWQLDVAGTLDLDLQPTVVAAAARHLTHTSMLLAATSIVGLRERVQIGRTGEQQGFWSGALHVDLDGAPLLRHRIELGAGSLADDELQRPLAGVSEFHYPEIHAPTAGVMLALAGGGCLSMWQGERLPAGF
jgi:urease accessory protein